VTFEVSLWVKKKLLSLSVHADVSLKKACMRRDKARKLLANAGDASQTKKGKKVEQSKTLETYLCKRAVPV
jgi:peptidyl-tRNA hydrolase